MFLRKAFFVDNAQPGQILGSAIADDRFDRTQVSGGVWKAAQKIQTTISHRPGFTIGVPRMGGGFRIPEGRTVLQKPAFRIPEAWTGGPVRRIAGLAGRLGRAVSARGESRAR